MEKKNKEEDFSPNSNVLINGKEVKTFKRDIISCNILEVEVGTTGHCGGDTGHGGKTYFSIKNAGDTDMRAIVQFDDNTKPVFKRISSIELLFGGDTELDTFCEALRVGYEVLKKEASSVEDEKLSPDDTNTSLTRRQERFALYINELCDLYRSNKNLKGMSKIRDKYCISGITKEQFFECGLDSAKEKVSQTFCNKVYDFILDSTKAVEAPVYSE